MRLVLALALVASLTGCATADQMIRDATTAAGGVVTTTAASWGTTAFEHTAGTHAYDCPPSPSGSTAAIYGSGPYTIDSSVCKAGVHAGVITFARGGRVLIAVRPGQNRYPASERNGVSTFEYGEYDRSIDVVN